MSDGRPDRAVTHGGGDSTGTLLLGQGDGPFLAAPPVEADPVPVAIAVGDFSSDSRPDRAVTHAGADSVSILINNTAILASCVGTGAARLRGWVRAALDLTGIPEVTLTLRGPGGCRETTTTNAQGHYVFRTLGPGTYTVTPAKDACTFTPGGLHRDHRGAGRPGPVSGHLSVGGAGPAPRGCGALEASPPPS